MVNGLILASTLPNRLLHTCGGMAGTREHGRHSMRQRLSLLRVAFGALVAACLFASARAWRPSYAAKRLPASYFVANRGAMLQELQSHRFGFILGCPRSGWII